MPTTSNVVSALRGGGAALANAWAKAPPEVRYKGAVYSKLSADTPEKRAWYLAAASMTAPSSILAMAPVKRASLDETDGVHFYLDADPSDLNDAKAQLASAQAKERSLKDKIASYKREMARWVQEKKKAESTLFKDPGSVLSLGIANAVGSIGAAAKIGWYQDQIEQLNLQLTDAHAEVTAAQAAVQNAQAAFNETNRQIRAQEEAARQEQLRQQQADAAARAAADAAAQRDAWAQQAAAGYGPSYYPQGGGNQYPYGDQGPWDPFGVLGGGDPYGGMNPDFYGYDRGTGGMGNMWLPDGSGLIAQDVADLKSDPIGYLDAMNEDAPGLTRYKSPWCFDAYYNQCSQPELRAMFGVDSVANQKNAHTSSPAGGFDAVSSILASIVAIAPAIVQDLRGQGPAPSEVINQVAQQTGVDDYLKAKADAAGQKAGATAGQKVADAIFPAAAVVGGLVALGIIVAAVVGKKAA